MSNRKLKVRINPEADVQAMQKAIRENDGYCPCAIERNDDTECMCKDFREMDTPGECHCGLFIKEFEES